MHLKQLEFISTAIFEGQFRFFLSRYIHVQVAWNKLNNSDRNKYGHSFSGDKWFLYSKKQQINKQATPWKKNKKQK